MIFAVEVISRSFEVIFKVISIPARADQVKNW